MRYKYKRKMQDVLKFLAAIAVGCVIVFAMVVAQKNCEDAGGSYEYDYYYEEFTCEY